MDYSNQVSQPSSHKLTAFHVSCWLMGLVAFSQLVSIGTAMAFRNSAPAQTEVITQVETRYVEVDKPAAPLAPGDRPTGLTRAEVEAEIDALMAAKGSRELDEPEVLKSAPVIADPVVERLLNEARAARIARDVVRSTMKLEEAQVLAPKNPNVLYELAVNFEALGNVDSAADYYMKVHELGIMEAGSLFKKAGLKLERGVKKENRDIAALSGVRALEPIFDRQGERRSVNIAITSAPERDFDPELVHVQVHFFEEENGDLRKAPIDTADASMTGSLCTSMPYDWQDGEEIIEVWYRIPPQDRAERAIFGDRKFHGFVAVLYYDGKRVDVYAQPSVLAFELQSQKKQSSPDAWDPDLDPILEALESHGAGSTLLPKLPGE